MDIDENILEGCLFFNVNSFSRTLLKIAEMEFKDLQVSPSHASLLVMVYDNPGIAPKQLGSFLNLTPSTITRFIDSLEKRKLLTRKTKGKSIQIFPTEKALEIKSELSLAYKKLILKYTHHLGAQTVNQLSIALLMANKMLFNASKFNESEL